MIRLFRTGVIVEAPTDDVVPDVVPATPMIMGAVVPPIASNTDCGWSVVERFTVIVRVFVAEAVTRQASPSTVSALPVSVNASTNSHIFD
jgi:hypothetical protein